MNGDDHERGVSRVAVAMTVAGACLWLAATAMTIHVLGVVVGLLVWVWGVPASVLALGGAALWCRKARDRRARADERPPAALTPAVS